MAKINILYRGIKKKHIRMDTAKVGKLSSNDKTTEVQACRIIIALSEILPRSS